MMDDDGLLALLAGSIRHHRETEEQNSQMAAQLAVLVSHNEGPITFNEEELEAIRTSKLVLHCTNEEGVVLLALRTPKELGLDLPEQESH